MLKTLRFSDNHKKREKYSRIFSALCLPSKPETNLSAFYELGQSFETVINARDIPNTEKPEKRSAPSLPERLNTNYIKTEDSSTS